MNEDEPIKRTTVNLPAHLLEEAIEITGLNITETLILGLQLLKRSQAFEKAKALQGKLHLDIDLNTSRERPDR